MSKLKHQGKKGNTKIKKQLKSKFKKGKIADEKYKRNKNDEKDPSASSNKSRNEKEFKKKDKKPWQRPAHKNDDDNSDFEEVIDSTNAKVRCS